MPKIEELGVWGSAVTPNPRTVYQRLAQVSAEVGVKATGKTAQGTPTLSIADVEDALRPLLAKHGLVTGYHWNAPPLIVGTEGKLTLWQADLTVWVATVDGAGDRLEDRVFDIGSSPSAAVSFALKRYYRALFHLADAEDETRSAPIQSRRVPQARVPVASRKVVSDERVADDGTPLEVAPPPITSSKGQALNRLMNLAAAKGITAPQLRTLSKAMFGKESSNDLTAEELTTLANEVDAKIEEQP